jgi:hypothetical protein
LIFQLEIQLYFSANCILWVVLSKCVNNGKDMKNVAMLVISAIHFVSDSQDLLVIRIRRAPKIGRNMTVLRMG